MEFFIKTKSIINFSMTIDTAPEIPGLLDSLPTQSRSGILTLSEPGVTTLVLKPSQLKLK